MHAKQSAQVAKRLARYIVDTKSTVRSKHAPRYLKYNHRYIWMCDPATEHIDRSHTLPLKLY